MKMKDEPKRPSIADLLGLPSIKFSRTRRPSNPASQTEDVHYDIYSPKDMADALKKKSSPRE